jgi:hypothetical protein
VSNKRKSRQTRRYSAARRVTPAPPTKQAAWRRLGSRSRRRPSTSWPWALALAVVIAGGAAAVAASSGGSSGSSPSNPPSGPALASVASFDDNSPGAPVDGIQCQTNEQLVYHIHSHLAIYVDGSPRSVPMGVGIAPPRQTESGATGQFVVAGSCFYWLHAHTSDGIIHIESPSQKTYTLGNYFDIWHQPLSPTQVGPAQGPVTAYVNGKVFSGNPRDITLGNHTLIQLDVGKNVAPQPYTFPFGY